jgi:hypothetical protein
MVGVWIEPVIAQLMMILAMVRFSPLPRFSRLLPMLDEGLIAAARPPQWRVPAQHM